MEKDMYESYEYLTTANNAEAEADQFFVVQNDGTLLINRQVEYVGQVQDVKGILDGVQPCTVYDVGTQQYYIDIDTSTELISVSDQLVLPDVGDNNVYTNSYLVQPVPENSVPQILEVEGQNEAAPEILKQETPVTAQDPENTMTEITLNEEQWRMFEEKGWVLFEMNGKIYFLDTQGCLHDITDNEELIQRLRNEILKNSINNLATSGSNKEEWNKIDPSALVTKQEVQSSIDVDQYPVTINNIGTKSLNPKEGIDEPVLALHPARKPNEPIEEPDVSAHYQDKNEIKADRRQKSTKKTATLNITVNQACHDIPKKIVLGKSANGKQIVAKMVSVIIPPKPPDDEPHRQEQGKVIEHETEPNAHLIKKPNQNCPGKNGISEVTFNPDDVTSAETIIKHLLEMPTMRQAMMGQNIVLIKVAKETDESGAVIAESAPVIVTGKVELISDAAESGRFVSIPALMNKILRRDDAQINKAGDKMCENSQENYLFVNAVEVKVPKGPKKTSITLSNKLPSSYNIHTQTEEPPHTSTLSFACASCNAVFDLESQLTEHEKIHSDLDSEEPLTIDTSKIGDNQPRSDDFDDIIRWLRDEPTWTCSAADIASAETIIKQLLKVPTTRQPLCGQNIVLSNTRKVLNASGKAVSESPPVIVTGRVGRVANGHDEWQFVYKPQLIQELDDKRRLADDAEPDSVRLKKLSEYVLHLNAVELKFPVEPTKTAISIAIKRLPAIGISKLKDAGLDAKSLLKRKPILACRLCAKVFTTNDLLKEHLKDHPTEMERDVSMTSIETDINAKCKRVKTQKSVNKLVCPHCDIQILESNYQRHLKIHFGSTCKSNKEIEKEEIEIKQGTFKCSMCLATFVHASTLSKHLMLKHVQTNHIYKYHGI